MRKALSLMRLIASVLVLVSASSLAQAASGGTAVLVRGKVYKTVGNRWVAIRQGEAIPHGSRVATQADGQVKILLADQTQINLGPNSSITLEATVPASVNVSHGQMRATVPPATPGTAAPSGSPAPKTRFFVRTPSAVLGVRGTDFQVVFNNVNGITSLLTYEGNVAMGRPNEPLDSPFAIQVGSGKFSTYNAALPRPTLPQKISPVQFQALKSQGLGALSNRFIRPPSEKVGSPIAPGLDARLASTDVAPGHPAGPDTGVPPEGVSDPKTGTFAPAAGGFLDLKSGLYVPPPPGSAFDSNTGVYIAPPSAGGVDPRTGEYVPPREYILDPKKGFVPVSADAKNNKDEGKRHHRPNLPFLPGLPQGPGAEGPFPPATGGELLPPPPEPVSDPYCQNCTPSQNPTSLTPVVTTQVNIKVTVQ